MERKNIKSEDAYNFLSKNINSYLIDTRTKYEWETSGIPDLTSLNKEVLLLEWPTFFNQEFINFFTRFLQTKFEKDTNLFFICKSGSRSQIATNFAINLGYINSFNIIDGFSNENINNWKKNLPVKSFKHH